MVCASAAHGASEASGACQLQAWIGLRFAYKVREQSH